MVEQWISSLGDDILNTGTIGQVDNFCVSDKVMPAYPEDHTLGMHVEDLELPETEATEARYKWVAHKTEWCYGGKCLDGIEPQKQWQWCQKLNATVPFWCRLTHVHLDLRATKQVCFLSVKVTVSHLQVYALTVYWQHEVAVPSLFQWSCAGSLHTLNVMGSRPHLSCHSLPDSFT